MALIKFSGMICRWYHANDEAFHSQRYQQQRARAVLNVR